jgi:hypothetical protein
LLRGARVRETLSVSDRTQTPEAPEPVRTPAVALDPAPMAPVGGLAIEQLGSVEAVLALQNASGNQAVNRVLTNQAGTGEATLPGALGAALVASRPSVKPPARKRTGAAGRQVADDLGAILRDAAAGRLTPEARAAQSRQSASPVEAGAVTATAGGGGFGGAGFVDPAGLDGGVASYSGTGGATGGHRIAADAGAGGADDAGEGSDVGVDGTNAAAGGTTGETMDGGGLDDDEMDTGVPGEGDADGGDDPADGGDADDGGGETDSAGQVDPGGADQLVRLRAHLEAGARAVDYFAEENAGATAWADPEADHAASGATRESWARRQSVHPRTQRRIAQHPVPSVEDGSERRRQLGAFRDMAGAGTAMTAPAERDVATAAIDDEQAARVRNDATRAQLLAWTSRRGESRES